MRPERILLLTLAATTLFFGIAFVLLGRWFDAVVVIIAGLPACKYLPAHAAANHADRDR